MSQARVRFEDVAEAAESIEGAGENPTIERIRDYLGKRGSYSTISKHLKDWRADKNDALDELHKPSDQIQEAVQSVWKKLNQESHDAIEIVKQEADERVANIQASMSELEGKLNRLATEYQELQTHYHEQSAQKELLSLDYKQLNESNMLLQERYQALEQKNKEAKVMHQVQLVQLKELHADALEQMELSREREVAAAQQLADSLKEHCEAIRTDAMLQFDKQKTEMNKLNELIKILESEKSTLLEQVLSSNKLAEHAQSQLRQTQEQLTKQHAQWDLIKDKHLATDDIVDGLNALPKEIGKKLENYLQPLLESQLTQLIKSLTPPKKNKQHAKSK